ncbi:MAG: hypothetical protein H6742_18685 [Alphaproteobacteria bacterium]|nr:hypothetical protein [Alphaproteobacteria bacterium]
MLILLALSACDRTAASVDESLVFFAPDVSADALAAGFSAGQPLLVGSRICGDLSGRDQDAALSATQVAACYAQSVGGGATLDADGCLQIDGAGEIEWALTSLGCTADELGFAPVDDRFRFSAVDGADVAATWDFWAERGVEEGQLVIDGAVPDDWLPGEGEALQVVAEEATAVPVGLFTGEGEQVAWVPDEATLDGATLDRAGVGLDDNRVVATLAAGQAADVVLDLHGVHGAIGTVVGVDPADVVSIEIVPAYYPDDAWRTPAGARAVLRTADGAPVFGAPVTWDVTKGALNVQPVSEDLATDLIQLGDDCVKPGKRTGTRSAVVTAAWADLSATATLSWTQPDDLAAVLGEAELQQADENWVRPETCVGGCGCAGAGPAAGWLGLLLGVVGAVRRRG